MDGAFWTPGRWRSLDFAWIVLVDVLRLCSRLVHYFLMDDAKIPLLFAFLLFAISLSHNYMVMSLIFNVTGDDRYGWFSAREWMWHTCSKNSTGRTICAYLIDRYMCWKMEFVPVASQVCIGAYIHMKCVSRSSNYGFKHRVWNRDALENKTIWIIFLFTIRHTSFEVSWEWAWFPPSRPCRWGCTWPAQHMPWAPEPYRPEFFIS